MIFKCFSIFDSKIGSYSKPVFLRSKGEAIRAVTSEVQNAESELAKYPADFTLFEIGEYDDDKGIMMPFTPLSVGCCIEFVLDTEK